MEPLEHLYFNWLCAKVHNVRNGPSFDMLFKTFHNTEFVWLLPGDDNRAEDGKELRREFLIMGDIPDDVEWRTLIPCSVFEMLIAFTRITEFNTDTPAKEWFWTMVQNLNLREVTDDSGVDPAEIQEVLEHFMFRHYTPNGDGGLWPIQRPTRDQTQIEIWDQFCDYLVDRNLLPH